MGDRSTSYSYNDANVTENILFLGASGTRNMNESFQRVSVSQWRTGDLLHFAFAAVDVKEVIDVSFFPANAFETYVEILFPHSIFLATVPTGPEPSFVSQTESFTSSGAFYGVRGTQLQRCGASSLDFCVLSGFGEVIPSDTCTAFNSVQTALSCTFQW